MNASDPKVRVSVVTPFFNVEDTLRRCIESVLAQSWTDWEYILSDNRGTDGSLAIAEEYAARDPRIRLFKESEHVPQVPNYNRALRRIASESEFCKIVQADDWLHPSCLERMVALAESDPGIGLVSSLSVSGREVLGAGLPCERLVFDGREVCRSQLLEGRFYFGNPTTVMYRADLVRPRTAFYDKSALHEDTEICYEILRVHRFGFLPEVLSYWGVDDNSITGRVRDLNPTGLDKMIIFKKYGREYLDDDEYPEALRSLEARYYRSYVRNLFGPRASEFRQYHREELRKAGCRFSNARLARATLRELGSILLNPQHSVRRFLGRKRGVPASPRELQS